MKICTSFQEIERKFFVRELPTLEMLPCIYYERRYLYLDGTTEVRIQHKGDFYELERKVADIASPLSRWSAKMKLSEGEYRTFAEYALGRSICFYKYYLPEQSVSIKYYAEQLQGFMLAEIEFSSLATANAFTPLPWMSDEVSHLSIARDSGLIYTTQVADIMNMNNQD